MVSLDTSAHGFILGPQIRSNVRGADKMGQPRAAASGFKVAKGSGVNTFLSGIRVLELGNFISGPFAGQLLAEMGAEVIKIEKPDGGDPFRSFSGEPMSPQFCAHNRGKRSIVLDLTVAEGKEALLRLAEEADVVLENFRPDVLDRLAVGWEAMRARNPRLIYCNISGFGPTGPYAKRPAYDTVAQAMSGFLTQMLDPEHPRIAGPAIGDAISGMYAALAIASAVAGRCRDGKGHRIDVPMVEAMAAFSTDPIAQYFAYGDTPGPYRRAGVSQSFAVRAADGKFIGLHLSSPEKFWDGLIAALERPDIATDPRFATRSDRVERYAELADVLNEAFAARPRDEWMARLHEQDVPHAPIYRFEDLETDPQFIHLGTVYSITCPTTGNLKAVHSPVWCDGARGGESSAPPELGAHSRVELARLGYGDDEIARIMGAAPATQG
jgi:crotonobetainyl-CoA:carnitine CoA-transferase CaiB-like acyl-CoA transferase